MKKILVICGPTATGKTRLGIHLAKKFNGEIISADSRQVYQGMNIGTGKDLENSKFQISKTTKSLNEKLKIGYYLIDGIKIWLYDIVPPDYHFTVADFLQCADLVVKNIWLKRKLPIIVGGTGFYINALVYGIQTIGVSPDWELRKKLNNLTIGELAEKLKNLWPEKWEMMTPSDRKNPRRLLRAIEIAIKGPVKSLSEKKTAANIDALLVGLTAPYSFLYQQIDQRVDKRIRQNQEKEISGLLNKGYTFENSVLGTTIGYREWQPYLRGVQKREDVIQRWKFAEHAYARRQMTWFKKNEASAGLRPGYLLPPLRRKRNPSEAEISSHSFPDLRPRFSAKGDKKIVWFDIRQKTWLKNVENLVGKWYYKK